MLKVYAIIKILRFSSSKILSNFFDYNYPYPIKMYYTKPLMFKTQEGVHIEQARHQTCPVSTFLYQVEQLNRLRIHKFLRDSLKENSTANHSMFKLSRNTYERNIKSQVYFCLIVRYLNQNEIDLPYFIFFLFSLLNASSIRNC